MVPQNDGHKMAVRQLPYSPVNRIREAVAPPGEWLQRRLKCRHIRQYSMSDRMPQWAVSVVLLSRMIAKTKNGSKRDPPHVDWWHFPKSVECNAAATLQSWIRGMFPRCLERKFVSKSLLKEVCDEFY